MTSGGADRKLKVLLFGPVPTKEDWPTFQKKLTALHQSKSGPFDVAFVVGQCSSADAPALLDLPIPVYLQDGWSPDSTRHSTATTSASDDNHQTKLKIEENTEPTTLAVTLPEGIVELAPNLFWLRGTSKLDQEPCGNIWNLEIASQQHHRHHHLVVAVCPRFFRSTDDETFLAQLRHPSYIGCDLLLTNEGPQGIENTLMPATSATSDKSNKNNNWLTSYDVAQVALLARARYHVATSCNRPVAVGGAAGEEAILFHQSHPFAHLPSLSSTRPILHHGRFLNMAAVPSKKQTKLMKVNQKFVHALGIIPLHEMNSLDWQEQQPTQPLLPCPFTDASYELVGSTSTTTTSSVGLSEAQARRLMANYAQPNQSRWELNTRKRKQPDATMDNNAAADDDAENATSTTLFVHGMHLDVSGQLQRTDSILLLQAFSKYNALRIRRPQGGATTTSYAFVEFETHEQAQACLQDHPNGTIVIQGVTLTLKWAKRHERGSKDSKHKDNGGGVGADHNASRQKLLLTEQEAKDSSTLYFRYLDRQKQITEADKEEDLVVVVDEAGTDANQVTSNTTVTKASELLRKLMEHTLEQALMGDDVGNSEDVDAVTAATEPALQVSLGRVQSKMTSKVVAPSSSSSSSSKAKAKVQRLDDEDENYGEEAEMPHHHDESTLTSRLTKQRYWFGFLQFASHAAASMALAALTGSIQGGLVQPDHLPLAKLSPPTEEGADEELRKSALLLFQGGLVLRWAMDGAGSNDRPQKVDPWAELGLQRRHFPPDARTDCWFCLASPTCERHLITGVYHDWYLTLPKGPVHPGHMLLVPVAHSSQGAAQLSNSSHLEYEDLLDRLRAHAEEAYGRQLFVFERAFQTRGGYHTHIQCIPVEHGVGFKLQTTLLAASARLGMNLREISSDIPLATILSSSGSSKDDEGETGYFYAEVPTTAINVNRLLYTAKTKPSDSDRHGSSSKSIIPPVQFGREALAAVLNQPDLAHWKACLVDQEKETELATSFRQSFAKFAPPTAASRTAVKQED